SPTSKNPSEKPNESKSETQQPTCQDVEKETEAYELEVKELLKKQTLAEKRIRDLETENRRCIQREIELNRKLQSSDHYINKLTIVNNKLFEQIELLIDKLKNSDDE